MFSKVFGLLLAVVVVIVLPLLMGTSDTVAKSTEVTISGKLVCQGCELKKADGARAACSVYGHRHAIKTADGKYINLLENQYSESLLKGEKYHNKDIVVSGRHFIEANLIDVKSYEVDGKKKSWCGHCDVMDGCSAMK